MSANVKYVFNPFSNEFDAVQVKDNISAQSVVVTRNCLISTTVGDLVMESDILTNGVGITSRNCTGIYRTNKSKKSIPPH
jgi:hypothetical protein